MIIVHFSAHVNRKAEILFSFLLNNISCARAYSHTNLGIIGIRCFP